MQTCSNCGATSREGAKFCTTCGSRLNPVADTSGSSGWESSPPVDETRSNEVVTDTGIDPSPEDIEESAKLAETEETPAEAVTSEWAPTEDPANSTTWSWGQTVADEPAAIEETSDEPEALTPLDGAPADEPDPVKPLDDQAPLSSWASQWSGDDQDVSSGEPETDHRAGDVPDTVAGIASDEPVEDRVASSTEVQDEPSAMFGITPSNELDDAPTPKERAQALIYELRELIDESFAAPAAEVTPGSADSDSALETLNALGDENGRFDSLRTILEKAREQPRDVDTMLNLLGEINSLIALVDRHQSYVSAVETAKRQLSS